MSVCPNCKYDTLKIKENITIDWVHMEINKQAWIEVVCNRCKFNRRMYIKKV